MREGACILYGGYGGKCDELRVIVLLVHTDYTLLQYYSVSQYYVFK